MTRFFAQIFLLLFFAATLTAQSPYELKTGRELAFYGTGLATTITGQLLKHQVEPLTMADVNALEYEGLNSFERWVTTQSDRRSDHASDLLLYTAQASPLLLTAADQGQRSDFVTLAVLWGETALLNYGLTTTVKNAVRRNRPFVYNEEINDERKTTRSARQSYFSGHTSQSAAMTFFAAKVYNDYHPDSKWKTVVWAAAAAIPATTGILRMTSGKHFPLDVMTGYVVGGTIGVMVPHLHKKKRNKNGSAGLTIVPTGNGAALFWQF